MLSAAVKTAASVAGGVGAAMASALCCAGPLVGVFLGVSAGGLASTFEPLRPVFVGTTMLALGYGHWFAWREDRRACEARSICASPQTRRRLRLSIWIGTAVAAILLLFPWWSRLIFD